MTAAAAPRTAGLESEDQRELRITIRRFVEDHSPLGVVRSVLEEGNGYDDAVWSRLCAELMLPGLAVPDELGGQGFGRAELGIAFEELGRGLVPVPFLSTAGFALPALLGAHQSDPRGGLVSDVLLGTRKIAFAVAEESSGPDITRVRTKADSSTFGVRLSGRKVVVLDAVRADLIVVVARGSEAGVDTGVGLYLVDATQPEVRVHAVETLDGTRRAATVVFDDAHAAKISGVTEVEEVMGVGTLCLVHDSVGVARRSFEIALNYISSRVQFGRTIGSFQAVKHRMADLLVDLETCSAAAAYASDAVDEGSADPGLVNKTAAYVLPRASRIAAEALHLHGGIGFTWEHDIQLYFKRAKANEVLFGDADYQLDEFAKAKGWVTR